LPVQFSRLMSHRRTKRDHFSISRLTQRRPARPDEIRHAPCSGWPFPPSRSAFQRLISPHRPSMRRSAATRPGRTLLYLGQWGQRCSIVKQQAWPRRRRGRRDHGGRPLTLAVFRHARLSQVIGKCLFRGSCPLNLHDRIHRPVHAARRDARCCRNHPSQGW
jgi:hypothetical protein